jgi:hypothetical protein
MGTEYEVAATPAVFLGETLLGEVFRRLRTANYEGLEGRDWSRHRRDKATTSMR